MALNDESALNLLTQTIRRELVSWRLPCHPEARENMHSGFLVQSLVHRCCLARLELGAKTKYLKTY